MRRDTIAYLFMAAMLIVVVYFRNDEPAPSCVENPQSEQCDLDTYGAAVWDMATPKFD